MPKGRFLHAGEEKGCFAVAVEKSVCCAGLLLLLCVGLGMWVVAALLLFVVANGSEGIGVG